MLFINNATQQNYTQQNDQQHFANEKKLHSENQNIYEQDKSQQNDANQNAIQQKDSQHNISQQNDTCHIAVALLIHFSTECRVKILVF
jgi:hypothetical protein